MRSAVVSVLRHINRWAGALGVLLGIVGVALAVWSVRRSEAIAEHSGAFQRADVVVGVGPFTFDQDLTTTIVVGSQFTGREAAIRPILLRVSNNGDFGGQTVVVDTLSYVAPGLESEIAEREWISDNKLADIVQFTHTREIDRDALHATFGLSAMPPGTAMTISIPVTLPPAVANEHVWPGEHWCADVLGKDVTVTISHERQAPRLFKLHPIHCQTTDMLNLLQAPLYIVDRRRAEMRANLNFAQYFRAVLANRRERVCVELLGRDDRRPKVQACNCFTFPIARWSYLFHRPTS
jgi:hypothetical protein